MNLENPRYYKAKERLNRAADEELLERIRLWDMARKSLGTHKVFAARLGLKERAFQDLLRKVRKRGYRPLPKPNAYAHAQKPKP